MIKRNTKYHDHLAAAKAIAYLLMLMGAVILVPLLLLLSPHYADERQCATWFIFPGVLAIFAGYIIKFLTSGTRIRELKKFYGSVIVLEIWIVAVLLGAVPFMMSGQFNFTQAIFETMSGLTTTGFTLFPFQYAAHLQLLILYRSLLHLVGGVGLVLVLTTVLSNAYGMQIFSAEGHTDRLTPSPLHSARTILYIYVGFILGGTIAFVILGMSWFDAFNYSVSAVATGGFAPHADNIGHFHTIFPEWKAVGIDIVAMVLMLLGATNFMASMYFLRGRWRGFFKHSEVICTFALLAVFTPIVIADYFTHHIATTVHQNIVSAFFITISTISTTGLTTVSNNLNSLSFGLVPIVVLMMIGGNSDSTAGGIKASRMALALKSLIWDVQDSLSSSKSVKAHQINRFGSKVSVSDKERSQNYTYIFMYLIVIFVGTICLMVCGYDFKDSLVEFASALGTIGISIGVCTRATPTFGLWVVIIGMLIARLEIYIFIFSGARIQGDISEYHRYRTIAERDRYDLEEARKKHSHRFDKVHKETKNQ